MSSKNNSRLVWSDERGGAVGDKTSKNQRKQQKNKKKPVSKSGGGFPKDGVIRICREKSGRGGKTVTVLYGVPGSQGDRKDLLKKLKQLCGCGGVVKESFLEIQGDQREKILGYLEDQGMKVKVAGG